MINGFCKSKLFAGEVVLIDKVVAPKSEAQNSASAVAAAGISEKIGGLQEIASKHGFNFLFYMLDIARAEAISLHHGESPSDSEASISSD